MEMYNLNERINLRRRNIGMGYKTFSSIIGIPESTLRSKIARISAKENNELYLSLKVIIHMLNALECTYEELFIRKDLEFSNNCDYTLQLIELPLRVQLLKVLALKNKGFDDICRMMERTKRCTYYMLNKKKLTLQQIKNFMRETELTFEQLFCSKIVRVIESAESEREEFIWLRR